MNRLKWVAILLGALVVLKVAGIGPGDLWAMASARINKAKDDSQALASGEYSARIANTYREEVAKAKASEPDRNLGEDDKALQSELGEARQKLLDDRAAALEKHAGNILRGDLDTLKRQVAENAKNASGGI
jgi:polyhydroxyalkanoate synthesis regulator phasin